MLLLEKWKQLKVAGVLSFNQGMHAEKGLDKQPGASAFATVCGAKYMLNKSLDGCMNDDLLIYRIEQFCISFANHTPNKGVGVHSAFDILSKQN